MMHFRAETRRAVCGGLVAAVSLLLPARADEGRPAGASRPNLVLLYADDLGHGDLGVTGNPHAITPNLDRMAAESVVFAHGYSPAPQCSPSRAAILTGQSPARLRITDFLRDPNNRSFWPRYKDWDLPVQKTAIDPAAPTLPKLLKGLGYRTAHFGKWHVGEAPSDPKGLGFDGVRGTWPWSWPKSWFSPYKIASLSDGPAGEYMTDRLTDEAIAFMRASKDRPFFINLWFYTPHKPLAAPDKYLAPFREKGFAEGDKANPSATYEAMKLALDTNVGRILAALDELGLAENTLVVFASDNGGVAPYARNHPFRGGKKMFLEGGIRSPTFFRWKGRLPASVNDTPMTHADLFPTFVELAGGSIDGLTLDSQSLVPLLTGAGAWGDRPLFWHFPQLNFEGTNTIFPQGVVRQGNFKLIVPYVEPDRRLQLYDVVADPGETRNLVDDHPDLVDQMKAKLRAFLQATEAQLPTRAGRPPAWLARAEGSADAQ